MASIVNKDIFIIDKESKDIVKKLMIVGNMRDILENKTTRERVEQYQMQVADWLIEIKLDKLCCKTICKFSKYWENNPNVFEKGSARLEIVNLCLRILSLYCEISHTFGVKIVKEKNVLEFVKKMLKDNHNNMNDTIDNDETQGEVSKISLSNDGEDGDENAEHNEDDVEENVEDIENTSEKEYDEHSECNEDFEDDEQFESEEEFEGDEYVEDDEQVEGDGSADDNEDDQDAYSAEDSDYNTMVGNCQYLLYHISLYEDNVTRLRSLKLLPVLTPYMSGQDDLVALVTVANIVNEKECKIINKDTMESLLKLLTDCLYSKTGKDGSGWSAYQCGLAVRRLARNDENHAHLLECNVLPLIVKLASDGKPEEQLEGVKALRYLAFNKDAKEKIVNDQKIGVVETLNELSKSDNDKIKEESFGALWTLKSDLENSQVKQYRSIAKRLEKAKSSSAASDGTHILISYQWDDQKLAKEVKSRLTKKGYKLWLDIENMEGSIYGAMSSAVEGANIVLVFMSRKYKDSGNCRSEAEYAHVKKKRILFVKTQRGYEADGWLGLLLGSNFYYEVSKKYPLDKTMEKLLKAIKTK